VDLRLALRRLAQAVAVSLLEQFGTNDAPFERSRRSQVKPPIHDRQVSPHEGTGGITLSTPG
jgi:hypothetical protein